MRRLRVVGLGDDDETVILEDPIRHERFAVPGDERLRAAARGDVRRLGQMEIETVTPLRPRDIQARIRAGESVEQVAAHGGVTHAHVERFAYPVLLERARVAELAGRARPQQEPGQGEARTLRESVTGTLATRGQNHDEPRWDAWKAEDGEWVVGLAWQAGRTDNVAHWTYRPGPSGGLITARDDPARELLGQAPVGGPRRVGERDDRPEAAGEPEVAEEAAEEIDVEDELPTATTASGEVAPRPTRRAGGGASAAAAAPSTTASTASTASTAASTAPSAPPSASTASAASAARRPTTRGSETRRPRGGRSDREVPDQRARSAAEGEATPRGRTDAASRSSAVGRTSGAGSGTARSRTASTGSTGGGAAPTPSGEEGGADPRGRSRRHPIVPSWEDVLLGVRSPRE